MLKKNYHFTAIGESAMHNLAIALKELGCEITGSDDEITEPARTRLAEAGLLPPAAGRQPLRVHAGLDAVVTAAHTGPDNPEVTRARELGIPVVSAPELIYQHAANKQRIVVTGSYGKTTIAAIIVHALQFCNRSFNYVMGSEAPGMKRSIRLSHDAPMIIIGTDDCFSFTPEAAPQLLHYRHHIGVISGLAWDHADIFPTEEAYVRPFHAFADATPKGGILVFNENDAAAAALAGKERPDVQTIPYKIHPYQIENGRVSLITDSKEKVQVKIFGRHNLMNLSAAKEVLKKIGITADQFYRAIPAFAGAAGRLEKIRDDGQVVVFKDLARAPARVQASAEAVKELYGRQLLTGVLEWDTRRHVPASFLPHYKNCLKACEEAIILLDPEKVKSNGQPPDEKLIRQAFQHPNLTVIGSAAELRSLLTAKNWNSRSLLFMSAGSHSGLDIAALANSLKA
jgi:UDP-N-acetylmuramate: L-alanyl-gamma-D-glutamyl-meso-diaminopimelate ligase